MRLSRYSLGEKCYKCRIECYNCIVVYFKVAPWGGCLPAKLDVFYALSKPFDPICGAFTHKIGSRTISFEKQQKYKHYKRTHYLNLVWVLNFIHASHSVSFILQGDEYLWLTSNSTKENIICSRALRTACLSCLSNLYRFSYCYCY